MGSHPPLPWRLLRRLLRIKNPDIQFRRITYPPELLLAPNRRYPPSLGEGPGVGVSYAPNGALICQPRATPGGRGCSMDNAPEGGKRITAHHCRVAKGVREIIILLPFLGECWLRTIPKPSLFLYVGKELWSFLSATYSQFRRICYPPAWSMRICYPINYEEPTPTHSSTSEATSSITRAKLAYP